MILNVLRDLCLSFFGRASFWLLRDCFWPTPRTYPQTEFWFVSRPIDKPREGVLRPNITEHVQAWSTHLIKLQYVVGNDSRDMHDMHEDPFIKVIFPKNIFLMTRLFSNHFFCRKSRHVSVQKSFALLWRWAMSGPQNVRQIFGAPCFPLVKMVGSPFFAFFMCI